ncbi:hypothetical protein J2T13_000779 [Paenibacillus sp. DS2015]|uniref:hypothetical protein n=1 Tax=Paenibacillus sp. DS2015 TaxID=3373917 RepID=UPI003D190689
MTTLCFYVSDYGYGHAARSIALIRNLLEEPALQQMNLIICTGDVMSFMKSSLPANNRICYRKVKLDVGYILKQGTIEVDPLELQQQYNEYIESFPLLIEQERDFLLSVDCSLVLSDISPVPFASADLLHIPSIGISNFTWYTGYGDALEESYLALLKQAYDKMDYFISLAGSREPSWGRKGTLEVDFYSREVDIEESHRIRKRLNAYGDKIVIYFSIGMSIHIADIVEMEMWNDEQCMFIVSSNVDIQGANIMRIPSTYTESQNYMDASDLVITKPGWSTISEAYQLRKPVVLLDRGCMPEDRNTIEAVRNKLAIHLVKWEELKTMKNIKEEHSTLSNSFKEHSMHVDVDHNHEVPMQRIVGFINGIVDKQRQYLGGVYL